MSSAAFDHDDLAASDHDDLAAAWHDLSVSYHRVLCSLDRELEARHQLSSSEFEVLELLWTADDHQRRMSDLADNVHLSQSALSRVVARLERDGLVERTLCVSDRRAVFAALTEAGVERYGQARPTQRSVLAELSGGCPQMLVELTREEHADADAQS
ncbi:MarR family transcriptional regulator [Gordonia sp. ABSL1-1]|uniref:MarR family winged helix-turn-helix transcriptional regulator n=1 Tax=Gordonia sp. ABSL1-1 TaxID=3053923 RepID=UPI002573CCC4|nr:MarR family transcriptional regulator [Gordonia sp. ABSL1-1]MDL9938312.1 MarR family transcriptional regulator [Gordonia sp. ABSL1-1]